MITIIGAAGFVGRRLTAELERRDADHVALDRYDGRAELGDVVWCAGVTADFRSRPRDTFEAHVAALGRLLETGVPDSLVYLSTTRFYRGAREALETDRLELDPQDPDHIYDLSKAAGESLAQASGVRALVLRPSNIYGIDLDSRNFLPSVVRDAVREGHVVLRSSLDSTRNYVSVDDVVGALLQLLDGAAEGTYNVAGPSATSNREIAAALTDLTGCSVDVAPGAPTTTAPPISTARVRAAVDYRPESVLDALPRLVEGYRRALSGAMR